jgi:hypothetical protein
MEQAANDVTGATLHENVIADGVERDVQMQ